MQLGCTCLGDDGACALYKNRPDNCSSFKCDLLKNLEGEILTETRAKALADEAKSLRQRAIDMTLAALPNERSAGILSLTDAREALSTFYESKPTPEDCALLEANLHYDIFVRFVRAHIRRKFRRHWKV